jgi:hypothetical protein
MPTLMEEPMLTTVITRPGQIGMDIKCVARTTILLTTITLALTTRHNILKAARVSPPHTLLRAITEALILQRPTIQIHTVIMEDTLITLIMTDPTVVFITGTDITGMRITK